jgi:hypothetical protein
VRLLALLALLLVALAPGFAAAQPGSAGADQVTLAQSLIDLDGSPRSWQVARLDDGSDRSDAPTHRFWIGEQGRIAATGPAGRALLDHGETFHAGPGDEVVLRPFGAEPASAIVVSLAGGQADPRSIHNGGAFSPGPGEWELVLLRDRLDPLESISLPPSPLPMLMVGIDGIATVTSEDGPASLQPGAVHETSGAGALSAGEGGATVLTAALLPMMPQPSPVASPSPLAPETTAGGRVSMRFYACDPFVTGAEVARARCQQTGFAPGLQIFELGSGNNLQDINEANVVDGTYTWSGLPDGDYLLNARAITWHFDRFFVPGLNGINSPPESGYTNGPNEGYIIPIGPETGRSWTLSVYLLRERPVIDIAVQFWQCEPGITAQPEMAGLPCEPVAPPPGFDLELSPIDPQTGSPVDMVPERLDNTDPLDPDRPVFRSVEPGRWLVSGTPPEGVYGFAIRSQEFRLSISLKEDRTGYLMSVASQPGGISRMDVYLLAAPAE